MIISIDICPSNRAKCVRCHNLIPYGELRGTETIKEKQYTSHRFYCKVCAEKDIEESIEQLKNLLNQLKQQPVLI